VSGGRKPALIGPGFRPPFSFGGQGVFSVRNMQEAGNMDNAFQVYLKMIYSMDLIQHILPENRVKLEEWF